MADGPAGAIVAAGRSRAARVLTPHRRRLLASRGTYRNLAIDAAWSLRRDPSPPVPLSWPLDPQRLAGVAVRWPAHYRSHSAGLQPARESRMARRLASLRTAMATMVRCEVADVPQPFPSVVVLEVIVDGVRHEVAIDQSPYLDVDVECAERCLVYFKRHFRTEGYPQANVVPGGFAPLKHESLERHLHQLRRPGRVSYDVYGRFSPHFSPVVRGRVLELLTEQKRFGFEGGPSLTLYTEYLRDIASSRICIDVPGEGPLSYRLVEYLAVGTCIVGYPHRARLHVPLVDRVHVVYAREDLTDLVDLCARYLDDPAERARLTRNARDYYDRYLHRDQLSAYHLHSVLERAGR
jgi:Glycosyl transferases group 1